MTTILDAHAPVDFRTIKLRPVNSWFDDEALAAKQPRRAIERKWLHTRSLLDKMHYDSVKITYSALLNSKKTRFYSEKIQESERDQ